MVTSPALEDRILAALDDALAQGEVGVQVAAYVDGELALDAWAGDADGAAGGTLIERSTNSCVIRAWRSPAVSSV